METTISTRHIAPTGDHSEISEKYNENSLTTDGTDESIEHGVSVKSEQDNRLTDSSEEVSPSNDTVCVTV